MSRSDEDAGRARLEADGPLAPLGARTVVEEIEQAIGHVLAELDHRERGEAVLEQAARERRIALAALGVRMDEASRLAGQLDGLLLAGADEGALLILARVRAVVAGVAGELPQPAAQLPDQTTSGALPTRPQADPAAAGQSLGTTSQADQEVRRPPARTRPPRVEAAIGGNGSHSPSAASLARSEPPALLRGPDYFDPAVIVHEPPPPTRVARRIPARSQPPDPAAATHPHRPADPWRYARPPAARAQVAPAPAADPRTSSPPRPRRGLRLTWPRSRPINWLVGRTARARPAAPDPDGHEPPRADARL